MKYKAFFLNAERISLCKVKIENPFAKGILLYQPFSGQDKKG